MNNLLIISKGNSQKVNSVNIIADENIIYIELGKTLLQLNPWHIPEGVEPREWIDGLIEIFCETIKAKEKIRIAECIYDLYEEAGVFEIDSSYEKPVSMLSSLVNFSSVWDRIRAEVPGYQKQEIPLKCFSAEEQIRIKEHNIKNYNLFGDGPGCISDLLEMDSSIVFDFSFLNEQEKWFLYHFLIMAVTMQNI